MHAPNRQKRRLSAITSSWSSTPTQGWIQALKVVMIDRQLMATPRMRTRRVDMLTQTPTAHIEREAQTRQKARQAHDVHVGQEQQE